MALTTPAIEPRFAPWSNCSFCKSLGADAAGRELPVLESPEFVAWVSRGPLVEGHLLVLPRRHALSMRSLDPAEIQSLAQFVRATTHALSEVYGPVCGFEHGPAEPGSAIGCSIDHAHVHLLPWGDSLVETAEADYPHLPWERTTGLAQALGSVAPGPYLLVMDPDGACATTVHHDIPSQALRRSIAAAAGRGDEWDWKIHPRNSVALRTLRRLRPTT